MWLQNSINLLKFTELHTKKKKNSKFLLHRNFKISCTISVAPEFYLEDHTHDVFLVTWLFLENFIFQFSFPKTKYSFISFLSIIKHGLVNGGHK